MTPTTPNSRPAGLRALLELALTDGVPRRSLWAALLVGTVLNTINQGDAIWSGRHPDVLKLALTYVVPYLVATYGAVSYRWRAQTARRDGA